MLIKKTKKHALRVSQQVLGELELSRDTIEINDKTNKMRLETTIPKE